MSSLADTQSRMRDAVVTGGDAGIVSLLIGGIDAPKRLAIHRRHYETSLATALLGKFPATGWLVGTPFLAEAARAFVRERPPRAPCIAEYGADFPEFLSALPGAERLPYLRAFSELEWNVGLVSIAIDCPPVHFERLATLAPADLPDLVLTLQPGVRYLHAPWPIDEVLRLYFSHTTPDEFALDAADTWIQVRGARGAFDFTRVDRGDFVFRSALLGGQTIGDAAEEALDACTDFDPGRALSALFAEALVAAIGRSVEGAQT